MIIVVLYVYALILDGITTAIIMRFGSGHVKQPFHLERNIFARYLMKKIGIKNTLVLTRFLGLFTGLTIYYIQQDLFLIIAITYSLIPLWNLTVILHYICDPELLKTGIRAIDHLRWLMGYRYYI